MYFPTQYGIINQVMKKQIIARLLVIVLTGHIAAASDNDVNKERSRRSSICSILVKHSEQKFADEIEAQFIQIPMSERFNDHNLSVRVVSVNEKEISPSDMDNFVINNNIASRLVARWFDRNILTGECTLDTIRSRGLYDASVFDKELAAHSARGVSMLEDAGEDLICNTYLLLNEINYVDKSKRSAVWGAIGGFAMGTLMAAGGANASEISEAVNNTSTLISSYKGFSVKIRTRLYRLVWDNDISYQFYDSCYSATADNAKKNAFDSMRPNFTMEYVGEVVSKGGRTSFLGIKEEEPELMIRKACARAIDENIVDLQHKFEPFRIKTPISGVSPTITAPIGMKEGVTDLSKFEVLEAREKNGKIEYHRVGTVKPIANQIWDNRFMSDTEGGENTQLGATSFIKTSGGDFYPGMLLREID